MRTGLVLLVGTLLLLVSNAITPLQLPTALAEDFSTTVAKSRAAIALVILEQRDGSFASGTGFRVAGSSVIVTAAHVVSDAKEIVVRYADGSRYSAKPVFIWQENDVALVQVRHGPSAGLPGRKSALHVGEPALVIGYPLIDKLGISEMSVTQGIVSAIHPDAIQLNVAVNPGNSGGPVLDAAGNVIGLVTGTLPGTGLAIATPWPQVKSALDAFAQDSYPVAISVAGKQTYITGWIEQGAVMVDANALADLLGGIVFWDARTKALTLAAKGKRLRFSVGSRFMDVDGQQVVLPLPMAADRRVPLKSVVAVLGGSVHVDLASFSAEILLTGAASATQGPAPAPAAGNPTTPAPAAPQPSAPSAPSSAAVNPGPRELRPGAGAGNLRFGMDGVEVSKVLGPPSSRQIWKPIPGLLYRPVQLTYQQFGISVLMANGKLWGIGTTTRDWVLEPYGVRVGDRREDAIGAIGYDYETQSTGDQTAFAYKHEGIFVFVRNDVVQMIVVFIPVP